MAVNPSTTAFGFYRDNLQPNPDKINNMHRSASSHSCRSKIRTPEHFRVVERRRQILLTRDHHRNRNYNTQGKDNSNR